MCMCILVRASEVVCRGIETLWLTGRLLWELHILNSPSFIFAAALEAPDLWFVPMLNKPHRASPAQTCMKCKMRKTQTQACRNICGESVLFYLTLFMLFEADFPKCVEKRKKWRREEHLKMHLQLSFHPSFFPLESRCRHQTLMFPPPIHKHNSFQLMNLWHRTHPYALTQALSSLRPYLNTKPYKPLSIDVPQPAGSECGLWHTT